MAAWRQRMRTCRAGVSGCSRAAGWAGGAVQPPRPLCGTSGGKAPAQGHRAVSSMQPPANCCLTSKWSTAMAPPVHRTAQGKATGGLCRLSGSTLGGRPLPGPGGGGLQARSAGGTQSLRREHLRCTAALLHLALAVGMSTREVERRCASAVHARGCDGRTGKMDSCRMSCFADAGGTVLGRTCLRRSARLQLYHTSVLTTLLHRWRAELCRALELHTPSSSTLPSWQQVKGISAACTAAVCAPVACGSRCAAVPPSTASWHTQVPAGTLTEQGVGSPGH